MAWDRKRVLTDNYALGPIGSGVLKQTEGVTSTLPTEKIARAALTATSEP